MGITAGEGGMGGGETAEGRGAGEIGAEECVLGGGRWVGGAGG